MDEEQNIEEQLTDNNQQPTENENISDKNSQSSTLSIQYNEENMEVHKQFHYITHKGLFLKIAFRVKYFIKIIIINFIDLEFN